MILSYPRDKDQRRIYDIVRKSMQGDMRRNDVADTSRYNPRFAFLEARRMNAKITDEGKRFRRANAALFYGLPDIAEVFVPGIVESRNGLVGRIAMLGIPTEAPAVRMPPPAPRIGFDDERKPLPCPHVGFDD